MKTPTKSIAIGKTPASCVDRWSFVGALLLTAYFLVTNLYIAGHRLFWYDEVFTTLTTRMPDWHTVWKAVVEDCSDPSPFGFFVVARTFDRLFGPSEIGIRLPSALAMAGGMLLTYDCARRVTNRLHGLIAVAVLTCSYLPYYGQEGRAYALFFLFAAAAQWVWTGKRSAIASAAVFFFGVLIHYYLVLCLVPFAAEEAYNWRPWRGPSARIMGGALGAAGGLAVLLPQILGTRRNQQTWWASPSGRDVPFVFNEIFPAGLFLMAVVALWVILNDRSEPVTIGPVSAAERTGLLSLTIPIAGYAVAKLVTHAFLFRYFIGLLPGVAVGLACVGWRRFPDVPRISVGILLLLGSYGVVTQALIALHADQIEPSGFRQDRTKAVLALEEPAWSRGARYIVFDGADQQCLEPRYYSKHPERYVWLWYSSKLPRVSQYYPMQIWPLNELKQHAREVVLVDPAIARLEALQQLGIDAEVHKSGPLVIAYLK